MQLTDDSSAGWMSADDYFAYHTSQQLAEQGLPTEKGQRWKMLRYIYTDGTQFAYRRGNAGDNKRSNERLFTSWQDADRIGAKLYMRQKRKQGGKASAELMTQQLSAHSSRGGPDDCDVMFADKPSNASLKTIGSHQQSRTASVTHTAAWPASTPLAPTMDGCRGLQHFVPRSPHLPQSRPQQKHVSHGLSTPPAHAATWSMPQQTASRSVTCKRLHSNASTPANNSRPSPSTLPPQQQPLPQQLGLPRDSPLAHAAAWPSPAAQTPMTNGRKRLHEATVAPASRLSEPSLSSKRKQQLVVDRQRPSRTVPASLDSMPCHVQAAQAALPWQQPAAACTTPGRLNPKSTTAPAARCTVAVAHSSAVSLQRQGVNVVPQYHNQRIGQTTNPGSTTHSSCEPSTLCRDLQRTAKSDASHTDQETLSANNIKAAVHRSTDFAAPHSTTADLSAGTSDDGMTASQMRQKPIWDWSILLYDSKRRRSTGQQLLLSAERDIGSGGCGEVMEVKVKLYGQDSLAAIQKPNQALSLLLQHASCSCGVIPSGPQQGGSSPGNADSCCCSLKMALKMPILYDELPDDMRQAVSETAYQKQAEKDMYTEYRVMDECQKSKYVIDCYALGALERADVSQLCLLLELSELGSVELHYSMDFRARGGLDDVATQKIARQVAAGITDMHQMARTLHRDVKWSNLLLFGDLEVPSVKLCDFNISKRLIGVGEYGSTSCGTPGWMAPEQADSSVGQDWRVDTFQLGLVVLALRTGRQPMCWISDTKQSAVDRANAVLAALDDAQSHYNNSSNTHSAMGAVEKDFVRRCITVDISRRPSAEILSWTDPYLWNDYVGG